MSKQPSHTLLQTVTVTQKECKDSACDCLQLTDIIVLLARQVRSIVSRNVNTAVNSK